jgi:hypothetical protein
MIDRALYEGGYATFQDKNAISNLFVGMKKALNGSRAWGLGDIIIKYPKTPGNLLARGIDYSPVGIAKAVFDMAKPLFGHGTLNQYNVAMEMGRGVTGTAMMLAFYALARAGIASGMGDRDRDVSALQKARGFGRYRLNLSAMKRFTMSAFSVDAAKEQPGDLVVTYDWAQPMALSAAMGASSGEKVVARKDALGMVVDAVEAGAETLMEQPLLTGFRKFFGARTREEGVSQMVSALADSPSTFVPTIVNQMRMYADTTLRDTKDRNVVVAATNRFLNRIPGASTTLPRRVLSTGETDKIEAGDLFSIFASPAIASKIKSSPGIDLVLNLYAKSQGIKEHFPTTLTTPEIRHLGKTIELSRKELGDYQELLGKKVMTMLDRIGMNNERLMKHPDAAIDVLVKKVLGPAREYAKKETMRRMGVQEIRRRMKEYDERQKR